MMDYHNWHYGAESGQDGRTYNSTESFLNMNTNANEESDEIDEVTKNGKENEQKTPSNEVSPRTPSQSRPSKKIEPLLGLGQDNETKVKIVAFTDHTYAPVAKWWYQRMTDLSYTTHTLVLVDKIAVEHFTSINVNFTARNNNHDRGHEQEQTNNPDQRYYRFETQIVDEGKRRKNKVRSLWYHRILYCLRQLKAGQSLLLTDVDNIFMRHHPLAPFYNSKYDAIFALEQAFPVEIFEKQGFVLCGGMTFLKATDATVWVMEKLLAMCDTPAHPKRCDDQVELNKMLADIMIWNSTWAKDPSRLTNGMVKYGFTGVSKPEATVNMVPFHAKIWDRDFAWRGEFSNNVSCPLLENNWVAMPHTLPGDMKNILKAHHQGIYADISTEKVARVKIWDAFCGKNGTHVATKDATNNGIKDDLLGAVNIYKATLVK